MIVVEWISYGRELERAPITVALRDIGRHLRDASVSDVTLELLYVVPGSLGGADFDGVRVVRTSRKTGRVRALVALPPEVAASAEPIDGLVAATEDALGVVAGAAGWWPADDLLAEFRDAAVRARVSPQLDRPPAKEDWETLLEKVELELDIERGDVGTTPVHGDGQPADRGSQDAEWSLEIRVAGDVSALAAVEDAITSEIEAGGLGVVDGNELGDGSLVVFVEADDPRGVHAAVARALERLPVSLTETSILARSRLGDVQILAVADQRHGNDG